MKTNKNKLGVDTIKTYMIGIILLVVLFQVLVTLFPTLTAAGDSLNASGFPLGGFFTAGGAIWYILPIAIITILFGVFLSKQSKK